MTHIAALVAALGPLVVLALEPADLGTAPGDPSRISNAEVAESCQWPTTVAFQGAGFCSGTLVHPEVVITAGHCLEGGGPPEIRFGERATAPAKVVPVDFCKRNPGYVFPNVTGEDYAFCKLATPVADIPIAPVLMGCETELLQAGNEAVIVGFGLDEIMGDAGIKRYAFTTIAGDIASDGSITVGEYGTAACSGDSGGPAYLRHPDGTWHAFGIVSGGPECGKGADIYALMHLHMEWFEAESGVDLTPCHDADGTWNPGPNCRAFATEPLDTVPTWDTWCSGSLSLPSETCGEGISDDEDPPDVWITSPQDGQVFEDAPASIDIAIDADDGSGWGIRQVWLRVNGEDVTYADGALVTDTREPYGFDNVSFPAGAYTLVAVAEDWAGLVTESEGVGIGVGKDAEPPPQDPGSDDDGDGSTEPGENDEDTDDGDGAGFPPGAVPQPGEREDAGCGCSSGNRPARSAPAGIFLVLGLGLSRRRRP